MKGRILFALGALMFSATALGHGDVAPQPVDVTGLETLGEEWREENPYRDNETAIEIGKSAYNQNCARCHGLDAISGGIAPDLRYMAPDAENDEWYVYRVREGAVRNGITYMPKMADYLSQEALWAIRTWVETLYVEE
jgi:cytochrome c-550 PedF